MQVLIPLAIFGAAVAYVWWRIFVRVGWTPWLALVMAIPIANLVVLIMFAFSSWPINDRVRELEAEIARLKGDDWELPPSA
ncbi:MAG: hypothetical protein O2812_05645 [Chloroflexi bacterium]|nr:hypothetical protein [Chloroflexota bacterium]